MSRITTKKIVVLTLALALIFKLLTWASSALPTKAAGNTFYVSKNGSNTTGQSWETAWNELNQINWAQILPGDTIYIDGGATTCPTPDSNPYNDFDQSSQSYLVKPGFDCGMRYESTLTVGASGTSLAPITIKLANEPGHNGTAVIFGGRSTPLPYCQQFGYVFQTSGVRAQGIIIANQSYLTIDGSKWAGIVVYGHNTYGMTVSSSASHILVRNLHIFDNGLAYDPNSDNTWSSDNPGVNLSGDNVTFEKMIIHDNGQDSFQSSGALTNFILRQSWLYNGREHPTLAKAAFNYCRHTDGIQIFSGTSSNLTLDQNIIGPRLMQGFLLGDVNGTVNNVTVKNSLIFGTSNMSLGSNTPTTPPVNWRVENVTSVRAYDPNQPACADGGGHTDDREQWNNLQVTGTGHVVKNSIFYGGCTLDFSDTVGQVNSEGSNNCVFGIKNNPTKIDNLLTDPLFVSPLNFDFSLQSGSLCTAKGSPLTSITSLFTTYPNTNSSQWSQTDWSGGVGQTLWSDTTKFLDDSNINYGSFGQISLSYTDSNSPLWYNFAWAYRQKITIDHTKISGASSLTDFPILVQTTDTNLAAHAQTAGQDILFTTSNGTTKLSHEIEKYDTTTGTLTAWVKIPSLSPTVDTEIYLYYGNNSASDQQSVASVWANGYVGVWHLGESTGPHYDSTGNNNDSSSIAVTQQGANIGQIDGADEFNGTSDQVHINDSSSFNFTNALTLESWVKPQVIDATKDRPVAGKYQNGYDLSATRTFSSTPVFEVYVNGAFRNVRATANLPTNAWTYTVGTYDAADQAIKLFINGQPNQTTNLTGLASYALATTTSTFRLGRFYSTGYFTGTIDEVRVSSIKRSPDWIATQYANQNSPAAFTLFGGQTPALSPIYNSSANLTSSILDTGQASTWGLLTFTIGQPVGTNASVKLRSAANLSDLQNQNFFVCDVIANNTVTGQQSCVINGQRYLQYQIILATTDSSQTPILYDLSLSYTAYIAPTPTSTPTPTFTPTPPIISPSPLPTSSTVNNNNHSSSPSLPSSTNSSYCSNLPPGPLAPQIFQMTPKNKTTLVLYFSPASKPFDHYSLTYGTKSGQYLYGIADFGTDQSSQIEVNGLTRGRTYYFRLRGGNGCAVGPWSNEIKVTFGNKPIYFAAPTAVKVKKHVSTTTNRPPISPPPTTLTRPHAIPTSDVVLSLPTTAIIPNNPPQIASTSPDLFSYLKNKINQLFSAPSRLKLF